MLGGFQPYQRQGPGKPGASLSAMLAGRPQYLPNPQDLQRATQTGEPQAPASLHDLLLALMQQQTSPITRR